jgi:hypothetical protein
MAGRYEEVKAPRFRVEQGLGGEQIRIKPRGGVFPFLFLPVWLVGWTAGGIAAIGEFLRNQQPFLAVWLCGWAVGWIFVAFTLAWMAFGTEWIGVSGGDLELGYSLFGFSRSRLYHGREISHLSASEGPMHFGRFGLSVPWVRARWGAVKFSYGGRTVYAAQSLDEAEGRLIVERLKRHLPQSR